MMVKNEEKNLKRCLDGLRPLLDKKDVELIIVDTGSTDQTAEIAREYTDKVYFHPWTDHFSDMRNITISYAKGSYILVLDADEVLCDPLLLYEYINDIRLESYNTYSVKIKNYESSGGYTVVAQERVFKNDGEFCYKGSVHNQPVYKTPVLSTDIYVDHYGYLFYDRELRERKFKRTVTILINELKKDPDNVYYRFQLARSYNAHHDMKEAEEEIEKAYQLISANKTQKSSMYVYGTHATILLSNRKWERGVKICSEGLEILPEYLDLYYMLAAALDKLGKRSEAQQAYEKYLDLVCRYDKLDISANRAIEMFYTGPIFQDAALGFIISELYNQKKYHEAYEYSKRIHEEKARVIWQVKCLLKLGKLEELRDLYKQDHDRSVLETIVQLIENEMECSAIEDRKKIETVYSEGKDLYSLLNQIRITEGEERSRLVDKAIKEADFTRLPEYYAEMLTDIDIKTRQVLSVFKRMSKSGIKKYVAKMQNCKDNLESFFEEFLINEQVRDNDFQSIKVYIGIAYAHLFIMASKLSKVKGKPSDIYYSIFKRYVDIGIKYTSILYNSQRLRLYYNTLEDQEDRFFIAMQYSMESIEKSDYKNGIRYFTEAARANPFMACYMDRYKDELFDEQSAVDIKEDDYE
jgi:glycosyltransferase involved in cell wall biosynthesis